MNPNTVTVTIAAASFIIAIFASGWLNQRSIERVLDQQTKTVAAKLEAIRVEISGLSERVGRIKRQLDQIFKPVLPGGER